MFKRFKAAGRVNGRRINVIIVSSIDALLANSIFPLPIFVTPGINGAPAVRATTQTAIRISGTFPNGRIAASPINMSGTMIILANNMVICDSPWPLKPDFNEPIVEAKLDQKWP